MIASRIKNVVLILALMGLPISCSQPKAKPITEVSPNELEKGILLDVRTPEEFAAGHLEGALNIDWFREDFLSAIDSLPANKTLFLYCKKGGRSSKAAHLLDSLGYKTMELTGGYDAWVKANP